MIYPLDSLKAFNADMLWDERFVVIDGRFYVYVWYVCKFPDEENVFVIKNDYSAFRAYSYELRPEASVLN